jgi:hypothetical protein
LIGLAGVVLVAEYVVATYQSTGQSDDLRNHVECLEDY